MKIAVIGTGFVGITQGACLAEVGHDVVCVDNNAGRIREYLDFCEGRGKIPIHEPRLDELILKAYRANNLIFSSESERVIRESDLVYICVGTPPLDSKNKKSAADLRYVYGVANEIGRVLGEYPSYKIIVDKSTVPVGTAKRVEDILRRYTDCEFDVVSNPEFLAEGTAVRDCRAPSRVVVGARSSKAINILREIYAPFLRSHPQDFFAMSPESAELAKYAANTNLAMQVVLANIFANLARKVGADWNEIKPAVLADPRIGRFVHPGLGFGGSCFRKDVSEVLHMLEEAEVAAVDYKLIELGLDQNEYQKLELNRRIHSLYGEDLSGRTFGVWGLSFKHNTSDLRDAASLEVIPDLVRRGAKVIAHDPAVSPEEFLHEMRALNVDTRNLTFVSDRYDAANNADGLMILVEWSDYRTLNFDTLRREMKTRTIYDGKDILEISSVMREGFNYYSIGRRDFIAGI
jgi:UDPglucose 6-dehydrogenase